MEKIHLFFEEANLLFILAICWALWYGTKYLKNAVFNAIDNNEEPTTIILKAAAAAILSGCFCWWFLNTIIALYER